MERDLDEVLASQEKMLARLGRAAAPRERIKPAFETHLDHLDGWLAKQPHIGVLRVSYNELIAETILHVKRISDFLERIMDVDAMAAAVDPALYRNRRVDSAAK